MYLFSFKKFAGNDRVFRTSKSIWKPGDLLETPDDLLLNLGEEVAFPELYTYAYSADQPIKILYPGFFDQHFLSFLHRMVYQRYSSYKSVMKYFVSLDIHDVLLREQKAQVKKKAEQQTLIIFPDNRSRYNMLSEAQLNHSEVINLVSTDTQNRKDIHRRNIKKGAGGPIIATQSEVFQPFCNLKKILFVDPHKWYYNNQQDPRYSLTTVVQQMSEIYGAPVEKIQNERSLAFPQ